MIKTKKQLYYTGKLQNLNSKLNIFILELNKNKDIAYLLDKKWNVIWYTETVNKKEDKNKYVEIAKISNNKLYAFNCNNIEEIQYYLLSMSDVIIVGRIANIKEALEFIDIALSQGKEIVCIKNSGYVANKLIKDGAKCV